MRFRAKIALTIVFIAILISIGTSIIYYNITSKVTEENYRQSILQNVRNQALKFDSLMQQMYYASIKISSDQELIQYIKEQYSGEDKLLEISILLHRYHITDPNTDSIYVYLSKEQKVVKSQQYKAVKEILNPQDYAWIQVITNHEQTMKPIALKDEVGSVRKYIFLYTKPIVDPETGEVLGKIAVNMDERLVYFSCLDNLNKSFSSKTELVDDNDIITSSERIANLGKNINEMPIGTSEKREEYAEAPFTGYRFVSTVDIASLTSDLVELRNFIIGVSIITMIISIALAFFFSKRLYTPIKNLKDTMWKLSEGDLNARADVKGNDEMTILSARFNSMADRIEGLIDELVTERLLKREAELEALQYQIEPHFMYNTLNSIKCAAYLQNAHDIVKLLDAFIDLLQSSISKRGAFITLKDELKLVENYVLLQSFRHRDSFSVEYSVDPDTEELYVPRLIIQPLVENAIFHGLDTKTNRNKIKIRSHLDGNYVIINVEDNGKGMSVDELDNISTMQKVKKEQYNHIGISNIKERISLYYGTDGSIVFLSNNLEGTKITIKIPASVDQSKYIIHEGEEI